MNGFGAAVKAHQSSLFVLVESPRKRKSVDHGYCCDRRNYERKDSVTAEKHKTTKDSKDSPSYLHCDFAVVSEPSVLVVEGKSSDCKHSENKRTAKQHGWYVAKARCTQTDEESENKSESVNAEVGLTKRCVRMLGAHDF